MSKFRIASVALVVVLLIFVARSLTPDKEFHDPLSEDLVVDQIEAGPLVDESGTPLGRAQMKRSPERNTCRDDHDSELPNLPAMAAALSKSNDPEHLLMASIFGGEERKSQSSHFPHTPNLDSLFKGLRIDPSNDLLLWNAVSLCAQQSDQSRCEEAQVPELATAKLQGNANFWLRLAGIRAAAGDDDGALEALERAVEAPDFKDYYIDHVELFARGIASYINSPYYERIFYSLGLAAAMWSHEIDMISACTTHSPTSTRWMNACVDAGETMEAHGKSLMTEALGIGLQQRMHEISGNAELEEAAAIRRQALKDTLESHANSKEIAVLSQDDAVLASYIDEWTTGGERQALAFLKQETKRVLSIPGYDPCD